MADNEIDYFSNVDNNSKDIPFFYTPSSPTIDLMQKTFSNATNTDSLKLMEQRQKTINHGVQLELFETNNSVIIRQTSKNGTAEVILPKLDNTNETNIPSKRLFRFILTKILDQAYDYNSKQLKRNYVQFNLSDLVKEGLYSNVDSARVALKNNIKPLKQLTLEGSYKAAKKLNDTDKWKLSSLFRFIELDGTSCIVTLEEENNWSIVISYYEILPKYIYELSNRTYDLCELIFFSARTNVDKTSKNGFITISLNSIAQRLALPDPNKQGFKNPSKDIKKPIITAIENLNSIESESKNYNIELIANNNLPIKDWLDTGYIKVNFYNSYQDNYRDLAFKKTKKIESKKAIKHYKTIKTTSK